MSSKRNAERVNNDRENHEGLMVNSNEEFKMLVRNKAVRSFARAEESARPVKLDLLLTRLYLAL